MLLTIFFENVSEKNLVVRSNLFLKFVSLVHAFDRTDGTGKSNWKHRKKIFRGFEWTV